MKVRIIRSDEIYKKMMDSDKDKKDEIFRYQLMKPFEFKWQCINVPIKAKHSGGYDVVMACSMLGFVEPKDVDISYSNELDLLSDDKFWNKCEDTISKSIKRFLDIGYTPQIDEYVFTVLLANPKNPFVKMSDGYTGDGGIPGYIILGLVPSQYTLKRAHVALAHECNHNIRWQFQKWSTKVTLADMMVSEGLAEVFAVTQFGDENIGPWVSKCDWDKNQLLIKQKIKNALEVTGFDGITPYLYGDDIAKLQGFFEVGLPYCAGYACGYYLVKEYLKITGQSIEKATLTETNKILQCTDSFWV